MHFYFFHTASLTDFTASSFCIERESSWPIPSLLGFMRSCEYFTDEGKDTSICRNIGVWGLSYRRLIDDNSFIDIFESFDSTMFPIVTALPWKWFMILFARISIIREDFPDPETPVTTVRQPRGIRTLIFLRLFSSAQSMAIYSVDILSTKCRRVTCFLPER